MSVETFSNFTTKSVPLTSDYLVGFDSTAEIKVNLASIIQAITPFISSVPVGTIITYSANVAPFGYLPCDGRSLITTGIYANLYNVIGTTYGYGAGTYNLPDLRGYFVRGCDNGRGIDQIDGTYTQVGNIVYVSTNTLHGLNTGDTTTVNIVNGAATSGIFGVTVTSPTAFNYVTVRSLNTSGNVVLTGLNHIFGQSRK